MREKRGEEWIGCLTTLSTIFQLNMWRHIYVDCRLTEEVGPTVGLQRHRHLVGFFNLPVQAPTRGQRLYSYSEKPPHFSRLLQWALGYGGPIFILNPRVPTGKKGRERGEKMTSRARNTGTFCGHKACVALRREGETRGRSVFMRNRSWIDLI